MQPTEEQKDILDAVTKSSSHILVEAVAGSGKTTTLAMIYDALPSELRKSCRFLTFNESLATELVRRGLPAKTFHAECFDALRKALKSPPKLDSKKMLRLTQPHLTGLKHDEKKSLRSLIGIAKAYGLNPNTKEFKESLQEQASTIDRLRSADRVLSLATTILQTSLDDPTIDYDDMLYLPYIHNIDMLKYRVLMIDEVQDFTEVQHQLVSRMLDESGRVIAVGDSQQAINAWRGALADSIDKFKHRFDPVVKTLSICWRCPKAHIELVKHDLKALRRFDTISPSPYLQTDDKPITEPMPRFEAGDLILAHKNMSVLSLFRGLIAKGYSAIPVGYPVSEALDEYQAYCSGAKPTIDHFDQWLDLTVAERQQVDPDDRCFDLLSLQVLVHRDRAIDFDKLSELFHAPNDSVVRVSTVHRSKGLEAKRVYLIGRNQLLEKALDGSDPQNANLYYVAMTRAKNALRFIHIDCLSEVVLASGDSKGTGNASASTLPGLYVKANKRNRQYRNTWISSSQSAEGVCIGIETYEKIASACQSARDRGAFVYAALADRGTYRIVSRGKVGVVTPSGAKNDNQQDLYFVEFINVEPFNCSVPDFDRHSFVWIESR